MTTVSHDALSSRPALKPELSFWSTYGLAIGLATLFCAVNSYLVFHHVMWRDEWHVWQVTHDTHSLAEMLHEIKGAGRPAGWYLVAWAVGRLGFYPVGLKVTHIAISTTYVFLFAQYSPFTRLQKALFTFSYFPLYEFGTILRDYDVEMILFIIACILFVSSRRRPLALAITLALLFQISFFGIMIGCALVAAYLYELWDTRDEKSQRISIGDTAAAAAVMLFSLLLAYIVMRPTHDAWVNGVVPTNDPVESKVLSTFPLVYIGYLPIPEAGSWNSSILNGHGAIMLIAGFELLVIGAALLRGQTRALVFYLLGTAVVLLFLAYQDTLRAVRYPSHFFIVFLLSQWLLLSTKSSTSIPAPSIWKRDRFAYLFLTGLLIAQCYSSVIAIATEMATPLSGALEAAQIIRSTAPPDVPVIGDPDYAMPSVAAYLGRPIYIAWRREYSTYIRTDTKRRVDRMPAPMLGDRVREFVRQNGRDVVLVINYAPDGTLDLGGARLIGQVTRALTDEKYLIILVPCTTGHS